MPGLPTTAYPQCSDVLALARAIIDDAYSASGSILTGTVPGPAASMSYAYINSAYRYLQRRLKNKGVETWIKEVILTGLTPTPSSDVAAQVSLSDSGYFDYVNNFLVPQLPTDLVVPQVLWQRQSGSAAYWGEPIPQANDGLPVLSLRPYFSAWEWREDAIVFPGATQSLDIRLRYVKILQALAKDTDPVLIRDSIDAMAYLTAWQYAITSGDSMIAGDCLNVAQGLIADMGTTSARRQQRGSHRRQSWRRGRGVGHSVF